MGASSPRPSWIRRRLGGWRPPEVLQHLFPRQDHLGPEGAEQLHQAGDDRRPAGLVAGAEPGAVVAVEKLVEQHVVLPVWIVDELLGAAVNRATPLVFAEEDTGHPVGQLL